MKKVAQNALLLLPLGGIALPALGQAVPAATTQAPYQGFMLPTVGGSLQWAVSASETVTVGYNGSGGTAASTNFSGDVAYISASENHPFSMIYTGGELISDTGNEPNSFFSDLALSQVWKTKNWVFIGSDTVSYLPDSPTTGLSGVLGVGDLGNTPVTSSLGQDILTTNNPRVDNAVSGSVVRTLTGATSLHATGSYEVLRFLDDTNDAIDSNQVGASAGIEHRINARNSIGASYAYSSFTYETGTFSFITQSVFLDYTPRVDQAAHDERHDRPAACEQLVEPDESRLFHALGERGRIAAAQLSGPADELLVELSAFREWRLGYLAGRTVGLGLVQRAASVEPRLAGRRNRALQPLEQPAEPGRGTSYTTDGEVASGQLSRGIGRSLSAFLSYAVERQTETGLSSSTAVFNGTSQVIGFGITYSPSAHTLNRK